SAVRFPASLMLIAAMNPTPKGDMPVGEVGKMAMDRYLSKLSGPLLDRIDIHIEAPAVPWQELSRGARGGVSSGRCESTASMRERVLIARERQSARQGAGTTNSRLSGRQLDTYARLDETSLAVLGQSMTQLGLSARAYDKIRRVARTIADVEGAETVQLHHVTEAIGYRLLDRK
ncbi:MAG: ATP-binding protein, partial [Phycisphaerales bacterium]